MLSPQCSLHRVVWARSPSDGLGRGAVPSLLNDREGTERHGQPHSPHTRDPLEESSSHRGLEAVGVEHAPGERALGSLLPGLGWERAR